MNSTFYIQLKILYYIEINLIILIKHINNEEI